MELPKEFKGTVYFYWWHKCSMTVIRDRKVVDPDYVLLGKQDITAEFSVSHDDAAKQIVAGLQKEKANIQARAQSELNKIDEKINSLLAITHQVEGE